MPDFNRLVGVTEMPTAAAVTAIGTLEDLEPGPDVIGQVLKAGINADFGARWTQAVNAEGCVFEDAPLPVGKYHVFPVQPSKHVLQAINPKFPCIFIYPAAAPTSKKASLAKSAYVQQWAIDYVMGPLLPGALVRLGWMLHAFAKSVQQIVKACGHPAYALSSLYGVPNPGDNSSTSNPTARRVFLEYFSRVSFVSSAGIGGAVFEGADNIYYASSVIIETEQRDGLADRLANAEIYTRGDFTMTGDEDGDFELIDMQSTPS